MADPILAQGYVNRALPGRYSDNTQVPARASQRGELYTQPLAGSRMHALADEGSYFICRNATPGTALAGHAAPTTIDDTKPLVFIRNTAAPSTNKRIYLDYIRLQPTSAGTNSTNLRFAVKVDKGNSRYSSGGIALTPISPNMDSSGSSVATVYGGAVVAAEASADVRLLNHGVVRSVIPVIADTYLYVFGNSEKSLNSLAVAGTAVANVQINCVPVVVGPEQMFLLHHASASQSVARDYEIEIGFWER